MLRVEAVTIVPAKDKNLSTVLVRSERHKTNVTCSFWHLHFDRLEFTDRVLEVQSLDPVEVLAKLVFATKNLQMVKENRPRGAHTRSDQIRKRHPHICLD